jgi:hypothetical protein
MRETTGRWLDPMIAAVGDRDDINMQALFDAATTVTKLEKPKAWWRPPPAGDEEERSVDWVRLGQLLREALGWDDYPEAPPD